MSKHNYSQYSNKNNNAQVAEEELNPITEAVEETVIVETPAIPEPVAAPVVEPKTVEGTVVGCTRLNVRVKPNLTADIVCVINANDKITVDPAKSTDEWYRLRTTTGAEGFTMRKYVEVAR